jgi:hypothetical protein
LPARYRHLARLPPLNDFRRGAMRQSVCRTGRMDAFLIIKHANLHKYMIIHSLAVGHTPFPRNDSGVEQAVAARVNNSCRYWPRHFHEVSARTQIQATDEQRASSVFTDGYKASKVESPSVSANREGGRDGAHEYERMCSGTPLEHPKPTGQQIATTWK